MAKEAKEEKKDVVKVEDATKEVSANLFGAKSGENFLSTTLGQNFSQVKKTLVEYKVEDIKREMKREIQDKIIDLRRDARRPQDDLMKIIPTSPMEKMNLTDIKENEFCAGIFNWGLDCHQAAQRILNAIRIYQNMFGESWDEDEKEFVKSLVINWEII